MRRTSVKTISRRIQEGGQKSPGQCSTSGLVCGSSAPGQGKVSFEDPAKGYVDRLNKKIRHQAAELASLAERLEDADNYASLVEQRLKQFCPSHLLPVLPVHITEPIAPSSVLPRSLPNGRTLTGMAEQAAVHEEEVQKLKELFREERDQRQRAEKRIREIEAGLEAYSRDLESMCLQKVEAETATMRGEIIAKDAKIESMDKDLDKNRREVANLRAKINRINVDMKGAKEELQNYQGSGIVKLTKQVKELESERDALLEYVQEQIKKADTLANEVVSLSDENHKLEQARTALHEEISQLQKELSFLRQVASQVQEKELQATTLAVRVEGLTTELQEVREQMAEVGRFQEDLVGKLRSSNERNSELEEQANQVQKELEQIEQEKRGLKLNLDEVSMDLKRTKDAAKSMEKRAQLLSVELKTTKEQVSAARLQSLGDDELKEQLNRLQYENQEFSETRELLDSLVKETQKAPAMPTTLKNGPGIVDSVVWCSSSLWRNLHPVFHVRLKGVQEIIARMCEEIQTLNAELEAQLFEKRKIFTELESRELQERTIHEKEKSVNERLQTLQHQIAESSKASEVLYKIHTLIAQSKHFKTSIEEKDGIQALPDLFQDVLKENSSLILRCRGLDSRARELEGQLKQLADDNTRLRIGVQQAEEKLGSIRTQASRYHASNEVSSQSLRRELENAAELAECQHALASTLGGRMEAVSAERDLLQSQVQNLHIEIDEAKRCLTEAITLVLDQLHSLPCRMTVFKNLAARTTGMVVEKDLRQLSDVAVQLLGSMGQALIEAEHLYQSTELAKAKATKLQGLIRTLEATNKASITELESSRMHLQAISDAPKMGLVSSTTPGKSYFDLQRNQQDTNGPHWSPKTYEPFLGSPVMHEKEHMRQSASTEVKPGLSGAFSEIQSEFKRIDRIRKGKTPLKPTYSQEQRPNFGLSNSNIESWNENIQSEIATRFPFHGSKPQTGGSGVSLLQERLKTAQATFNYLRQTAEK